LFFKGLRLSAYLGRLFHSKDFCFPVNQVFFYMLMGVKARPFFGVGVAEGWSAGVMGEMDH
jgi:hypothetical protein